MSTAATSSLQPSSPVPGRVDDSERDGGSEYHLSVPRHLLANFESSVAHEWLVTNGIGGFAAGTVALANTRRYHGLLVASLRPPLERTLLVAKLDVAINYRGTRYDLSTNEFADGTQTHGHRYLQSFHLDGSLPVWTYVIGDAVIEQRLWMRHGENTTYVTLTLKRGARAELELTPLCAYRDYHWHQRGSREVSVQPIHHGIEIAAQSGARSLRILSSKARVEIAPSWYWNFKHRVESERGLDDVEDLYRPARLHAALEEGETVEVVLTAGSQPAMNTQEMLAAERVRQRTLVRTAQLDHAPSWIQQLVLAADQFVVARQSMADEAHGVTVIAGYPWFSDWGRDTMIALPGLAIATHRLSIAREVLLTFSRYVSEGMLPNRFPDQGDAPEYNTVDATLWYFVAVDEYLRAHADRDFLVQIYPVLNDIVQWHIGGTRYGIHVDPADHLLSAGEPGVQLTWMDAKVGDWVVTPRIGKPIEINALWFNAICIMQNLATELGDRASASRYRELAGRIRESFSRRFWHAEGRYLYDVIDTPDGRDDNSVRPNQLFAISLRHALLGGERAKAVVDRCAAELYTPMGLRSLSPHQAGYAGRYSGSPPARDAVYHQGTVWSWLLGPFALAHYRVYRNRQQAMTYLESIAPHLAHACIGQISEIFDGDVPHEPRGCFAQAWSTGEILRAWSIVNE